MKLQTNILIKKKLLRINCSKKIIYTIFCSTFFFQTAIASHLSENDYDKFRSPTHQTKHANDTSPISQSSECQKEITQDVKDQSTQTKYWIGGAAGAAITLALIIVGFPPRIGRL